MKCSLSPSQVTGIPASNVCHTEDEPADTPRLLENFNNTEAVNYQLKLRLVEVLAAPIHQISVALYNMQDKCHDEAAIRSVTSWERPRRPPHE